MTVLEQKQEPQRLYFHLDERERTILFSEAFYQLHFHETQEKEVRMFELIARWDEYNRSKHLFYSEIVAMQKQVDEEFVVEAAARVVKAAAKTAEDDEKKVGSYGELKKLLLDDKAFKKDFFKNYIREC